MDKLSEIPPDAKSNFRKLFGSNSTSEEVMKDVDVSGKVYIVTGAATGLGYYSCLMLAKKGALVVITCRSEERVKETLTKLKSESGSESVRGLVMDQLDLAQVRSAALEFLSWNIELHGLMLNAGIAAGDYKKSAQGHESHFAVNHLSHYLFAALLTDKLKETAKESSPARIVILSSESHRHPKMNEIDYSKLSVEKSGYWSMIQYGRSKFCNVLHMYYLARQLYPFNIHVNSIHPGNLVKTEITRQSWGFGLLSFLSSPFTKSCSQGAATQLFVIAHEATKGMSGIYWNHCCPYETIPQAVDLANAEKLDELSKKLVKDFI